MKKQVFPIPWHIRYPLFYAIKIRLQLNLITNIWIKYYCLCIVSGFKYKWSDVLFRFIKAFDGKLLKWLSTDYNIFVGLQLSIELLDITDVVPLLQNLIDVRNTRQILKVHLLTATQNFRLMILLFNLLLQVAQLFMTLRNFTRQIVELNADDRLLYWQTNLLNWG
jgi:hypothetical protein